MLLLEGGKQPPYEVQGSSNLGCVERHQTVGYVKTQSEADSRLVPDPVRWQEPVYLLSF